MLPFPAILHTVQDDDPGSGCCWRFDAQLELKRPDGKNLAYPLSVPRTAAKPLFWKRSQTKRIPADLVVRPAEDWWMLGMRTLARTQFQAGVLRRQDQSCPNPKEAASYLSTLPRSVQGLSVTVKPEDAGSFQLFPTVRYPHRPGKGFEIDLRMGHAAYLAQLDSAGRRRFRRAVEKYRELNGGDIDFRVYRTRLEAEEYVRLAAQVTPKTHQWKENRMGVTTEDLQTIQADAERDAFRGYLLFLNDAPIAYCSSYGLGDVVVGDRIGFDPEQRACYPGFALLALLLEELFQDRFETLDLGPDGFDYKSSIATRLYETVDVFFLRPTPRWMVWALAHRSFSRLNRGLSSLKSRLRG